MKKKKEIYYECPFCGTVLFTKPQRRVPCPQCGTNMVRRVVK